jgi:long-chain acyl-CoA synthetase
MPAFSDPSSFPETSANVALMEHKNLEKFGKYNRLYFEDRSYTNVEELQSAGSLARILQHHGVMPGDRVVLLMPNTPELTACFQAIWTMGGVVVPVMPQWTAPEIAHVLKDSGAQTVVTIAPLAPRIAEANKKLNCLRNLLVFGECAVPGAKNILHQWMTGPKVLQLPVNCAPETIAMLLYTSGTTAAPKGVIATHGNVAAAVNAVCEMNADMPRLPMLHALPLTHVFGVLLLRCANQWGLTSVLVPQFEPTKVFAAIEQHQIGYLPVVPTMMLYLMSHPERARYKTTSLYRTVSGGAALPEQVRVMFSKMFPGRVDQGYGMSESIGIATVYDDHDAYRPGSAGRPVPGLTVRIVDENNQPLPPRQVGEICLVGPNISPGYWNDASATKDAFEGGWFHTGDIGYQDEDGFLYVTDRKKDLIIKGGENISPREIEEVLYLHPAVAEAAVVGVSDAKFGEDICAVIQNRPGVVINDDEIRAHVGRHLTKFKVPARVVFCATLPKSSTGKVQKRILREQLKTSAAAA